MFGRAFSNLIDSWKLYSKDVFIVFSFIFVSMNYLLQLDMAYSAIKYIIIFKCVQSL